MPVIFTEEDFSEAPTFTEEDFTKPQVDIQLSPYEKAQQQAGGAVVEPPVIDIPEAVRQTQAGFRNAGKLWQFAKQVSGAVEQAKEQAGQGPVTIPEGTTVPGALASHAANVALSIPQFLETPAGGLALPAGMAFPAATAAAFTGYGAKNLYDVATQDTSQMTIPQKVAHYGVDIPASIAMTVLPGIGAVEGLKARLPMKGPNASQIRETAPVYGDVRTQPEQGAGQVPVAQGGGRVQPQAQALPEEAQVLLNQEGASMDVPILTSDRPAPRPGQFMGANRETGQIEVYPKEFNEWLKAVPAEQRAQAVASRLGEERIHLATTDEQADAYWNSLTAAEKLATRRIYTGRFRDTGQFSNTVLGHEALRYRIQQLQEMSPSEVAEAARRERWTVKTLAALSDIIRTIREKFGTKASGAARAILDRVQETLANEEVVKAVQEAEEPEAVPAAVDKQATEKEAERVAAMSPQEFTDWVRAAGIGPTDAGYEFAKQYGETARPIMEQLAKRQDEEMQAASARAKAAPREQMIKAMEETLQRSGRKQFFDEGLRLLDAGKSVAEGMTPEAAAKEHGVTLKHVIDLAARQRGPAAISKPQMELGLTQEKGERPTAEQLGARSFSARDLEAIATQHIQEKLGGTGVPDFKSFSKEVRSKFGEAKPGQLFDLYQDSLYKNLFAATGEQLRALGKKLGLKIRNVADAPAAEQPAARAPAGNLMLEYEPTAEQKAEAVTERLTAKKEQTTQQRLEERVRGARQRYRTTAIEKISQKLLAKATRQAQPPTRSSVSVEDLSSARQPREPVFFDISTSDLKSPLVLAQRLVQGARRSERDPETMTKRLTALVDKETGKTYLVSTYDHPRGGAMLVDPTLSSVRAHRPLSQILKKYRPVASVLLDEPVQNFRQSFDSLGDFENKFGTDARRASQAVLEEPLREGEAEQPGSWESGAPVTDAEAGAIMDHVMGEVGAFNGPDDVLAALAAIPEEGAPFTRRAAAESATLQALSGYRKLAAEILKKNPDLTNEELLNQLAEKIYETHKGAPDLETFVRQTMAQGRAPRVETPTARPNAPAPETARELMMRSRRAPTSVLPQNIPPEEAAKLGTQPAPPVPEGTLEGPAAINKFVDAGKDMYERVGDVAKFLAMRQQTVADVALGLDKVDNTVNNLASQPEQAIRTSSGSQRGNPEILDASSALIEGRFDRGRVAGFLQDLAVARRENEAMRQSADVKERRLADAHLRDIEHSEREVNYALAHWNDPELQATARKAKRALDAQYALLKSLGYDINKEEGYVPHRLLGVFGSAQTLFQLPRVLGTRFQAPRTFETHYEALANGPYMRVTHDVASLVGHYYRRSLAKIYGDQWQQGLTSMTLLDGSPVAMKAKQTPTGWASPDPAYKIINTHRGPIAVHDSVADPIEGLFNDYFSKNPVAGAILRFEQQLKHGLLIGDFFHFARMFYYGLSIAGTQALRSPQNIGRAGWSVLNMRPGDVPEAIRKGIISQKDADWADTKIHGNLTRRDVINMAYQQFGANLGRIQDALYKDLMTQIGPDPAKPSR